MPKTPCEFIGRQSGFFSKSGSAALPVGSLATALSIGGSSPGVFVGETVTSDFGTSPAIAAVTDTQSNEAKTGTASLDGAEGLPKKHKRTLVLGVVPVRKATPQIRTLEDA